MASLGVQKVRKKLWTQSSEAFGLILGHSLSSWTTIAAFRRRHVEQSGTMFFFVVQWGLRGVKCMWSHSGSRSGPEAMARWPGKDAACCLTCLTVWWFWLLFIRARWEQRQIEAAATAEAFQLSYSGRNNNISATGCKNLWILWFFDSECFWWASS